MIHSGCLQLVGLLEANEYVVLYKAAGRHGRTLMTTTYWQILAEMGDVKHLELSGLGAIETLFRRFFGASKQRD